MKTREGPGVLRSGEYSERLASVDDMRMLPPYPSFPAAFRRFKHVTGFSTVGHRFRAVAFTPSAPL
ncbi:MAG TPA: hypothetical protein VJO54_09480 [Burkholderiales bacterium]|nr:hypothetical protein [Burkholderiales bacterium]